MSKPDDPSTLLRPHGGRREPGCSSASGLTPARGHDPNI